MRGGGFSRAIRGRCHGVSGWNGSRQSAGGRGGEWRVASGKWRVERGNRQSAVGSRQSAVGSRQSAVGSRVIRRAPNRPNQRSKARLAQHQTRTPRQSLSRWSGTRGIGTLRVRPVLVRPVRPVRPVLVRPVRPVHVRPIPDRLVRFRLSACPPVRLSACPPVRLSALSFTRPSRPASRRARYSPWPALPRTSPGRQSAGSGRRRVRRQWRRARPAGGVSWRSRRG